MFGMVPGARGLPLAASFRPLQGALRGVQDPVLALQSLLMHAD